MRVFASIFAILIVFICWSYLQHFYSIVSLQKFVYLESNCELDSNILFLPSGKKDNKINDSVSKSCQFSPRQHIEVLCGLYGNEIESEYGDMFNTWPSFVNNIGLSGEEYLNITRKLLHLKPYLLGDKYNVFVFSEGRFFWLKFSGKGRDSILDILVNKNRASKEFLGDNHCINDLRPNKDIIEVRDINVTVK